MAAGHGQGEDEDSCACGRRSGQFERGWGWGTRSIRGHDSSGVRVNSQRAPGSAERRGFGGAGEAGSAPISLPAEGVVLVIAADGREGRIDGAAFLVDAYLERGARAAHRGARPRANVSNEGSADSGDLPVARQYQRGSSTCSREPMVLSGRRRSAEHSAAGRSPRAVSSPIRREGPAGEASPAVMRIYDEGRCEDWGEAARPSWGTALQKDQWCSGPGPPQIIGHHEAQPMVMFGYKKAQDQGYGSAGGKSGRTQSMSDLLTAGPRRAGPTSRGTQGVFHAAGLSASASAGATKKKRAHRRKERGCPSSTAHQSVRGEEAGR